MPIPFPPLTMAHKALVQLYTLASACRNCDLSFLNLVSWRFLYDTQLAEHRDHLLFRFKANGHNAYLAPLGHGPLAPVLTDLMAEAGEAGEPFLMLGVSEPQLAQITEAMPSRFYAHADRAYTDYLYSREAMATLAGKRLQAKRNFANRFARLYPAHRVLPLTANLLPACLALAEQWVRQKALATDTEQNAYEAERRAMHTAFDHWDELDAQGVAVMLGNDIVAFSYGAAINYDTFDVCAEKADTRYEGAFAFVSRALAQSLPACFEWLNREEDLGIEGLRRSKLSYHPTQLLHKYTVMTHHPFMK